jgi:hypothetical protein
VPNWAKVVTLIIGLGGYSGAVVATLLQGKIPDVATLGIPALLIAALAPQIRIGRNRASGRESARRGGRAAAADDGAADDEGDEA